MERNKKINIVFLVFSICIITILHYFTAASRWDIHDFLRRLYYIPIITAAFSFRLKGGTICSIIISILYAPHLFIPNISFIGFGDITLLNQFLEIIMFIIIGAVTGFLVETDYMKKKMLELQIKKLTDLENYTQDILDSITNSLIAVDKDLKIKSINKEGKKLFKLDDPLGKGLDYIFIEHDKLEKIICKILLKNEKIADKELKIRLKSGQGLHVKLIAYPLYNILEQIEGVVIVLEDISKIKKLEHQIRRAEKLSAIGELASGIAHEIRNPLGIIKTISQTIKSEIYKEDVNDIKEGLEIIINEVNRANTVIKGILDFARPNIHYKKYYRIKSLIEDVLLITNKYTQQHHVKVDYNILYDREIFIDVDRLKQAFINIILNSVQAMGDGGSIDINISSEDEFIKISFRDTGIGIREEDIERIFDPFYTTKDTGTGLGLSITHRIIEEHKGYIQINSRLEKGTEVIIYLPAEGDKHDKEDTNS